MPPVRLKDLPDRRDVRRDAVVPAENDISCPECGHALFIDCRAERHDQTGRVTIVRAAFCEF